MTSEPHPQPTLRDIWSAILPRFSDRSKPPAIPRWPPDVFALCAHALKQQSRYVGVVAKDWPPLPPAAWAKQVREIAFEWLLAWPDPNPDIPPRVQIWWADVCLALDEALPLEPNKPWPPEIPLMRLLSIADEACTIIRTDLLPTPSNAKSLRWAQINTMALQARNNGSSVCDEVPPSKLRVLPKDRVPQKGFTIRSLSLYACLIDGVEIIPRIESSRVFEDPSFNILVIPWPFIVRPEQLHPPHLTESTQETMPSEFGFFTFDQGPFPSNFCEAVEQLLIEAERDADTIRLVLLPELALNERLAEELASKLRARGTNLICGVGEPSSPGRYGTNYVYYSLLSDKPPIQHKHHRWKLDDAQIQQYSVGTHFQSGTQYWEHIDLSNRTLSFVRLQEWLNTCVLICEDLARPDPVGDIIRAVGPNLTIALLMDGPQLERRWPARHAATLAEDPGSSVLTVTNLGMSELSKPLSGPDRSRVIALWRESGSSTAREIELPTDRNCFTLSLSMRETRDWAADGRSRFAATPKLTDVRFFNLVFSPNAPTGVSCEKENPNAE
jgi:hypothetical protein